MSAGKLKRLMRLRGGVLFKLKSRIFKGRFKKEFDKSGKREALALSKFVGKDATILDLGCGVGRIGEYLAPFVQELHGAEVCKEMVQYARYNCQNRAIFSSK